MAYDDVEVLLFHYQCRCVDNFFKDSFEREYVGIIYKRESEQMSFYLALLALLEFVYSLTQTAELVIDD